MLRAAISGAERHADRLDRFASIASGNAFAGAVSPPTSADVVKDASTNGIDEVLCDSGMI